jgi:hypothetical protein
VVYGNAAEFPSASINSPGYLLGGPVTVPVASTVTHLGVIGKQAGPNAMLALYSSDSQGRPHRLLAATPAVSLEVGPMEVAVTPQALAAGTYWLVGTFDADASIGIDETDPMAPVRYVNQQFGAGLPDPFGPAFAYSGQRFNYYVRVE